MIRYGCRGSKCAQRGESTVQGTTIQLENSRGLALVARHYLEHSMDVMTLYFFYRDELVGCIGC